MAKSEEKMMSESEAWKQLEELFGSDSVVRPDEVVKTDVIKTTTPSLDRAIGVGGWPRGRLIQLAGAPSSGKTLLALLAIAEWQSEHPENCAAFLDAEYTYSAEWAAKFGVDNDRVYLIKSNEAAKIFGGLVGKVKKNAVTGKLTKIPGLFDMIAAGQSISYVHPETKKKVNLNCGRMGVVVLDSIANLQVPQEVEADVGKSLMAAVARFLTVELKKLTPGIAKANVAMIGINQVRVNPGQMFGNPEDTPGGKALKHACSIMVEVGPMSGSDNLILDSREEKQGHKIRAKITKNKLGAPFKVAEFFVDFRSGVVRKGEELLELGVKLNLFERPNNRSYIINKEKLNSRDAAIEFCEANKDSIESAIRDYYLSGSDSSSDMSDATEEAEVENPFDDEIDGEIV
jgi:recombination protein RecA